MDRYAYDESNPLSKPYNQRGTFNAYYKGVDTLTNEDVLISEFKEPRYDRMVIKSKRLNQLKEVSHSNIAKIYNTILVTDKKVMYVILQWCEGGSLYQYQKNQNTFDFELTMKIIKQIAGGLQVIHEANQIHRFVNMENIQFHRNGKTKLTFKCLYPKAIYLSPEQKKGIKTKENDIFSLGVLAYKMLFSTIPFKGNNLDEQIESVKQGVKFPRNDHQIFPITINSLGKQLITSMTHSNPQGRVTCEQIIRQIKVIFKEPELKLQASAQKQLFQLKGYYPIFNRYSSKEQSIIIALKPDKKQLVKIDVVRGNQTALKEYENTTIGYYTEVKEVIGIVQIYQIQYISNNYLYLVSSYDNQSSLKLYLQNGGSLSDQTHSIKFIAQLTEKLKKFGKTHNYLSTDTILIRKGQFYLNYPPFMTKEYLQKLKKSKKQIGMIAPQIKDRRQSQNADSWSIAVLKFFLQNNVMPNFDKTKKAIIPSKHKKSVEEITFYDEFLVEDPEKRGNILDKYQEGIQILQQQQLQQIQVLRTSEQKKKIVLESIKQKLKLQQKEPTKTYGQLLSQRCLIFLSLEKHWTKPIRVGLKILVGLIFLLFLFYLNFFIINGQLIAEHSIYSETVVRTRVFQKDSTPSINYNLVTKTPSKTYQLFYNTTLTVLRDEYQCVLNSYSVGSNIVEIINRPGFITYQIFGIVLSIFNLVLFCLMMSKMDFPKVYFISNFEENDFEVLWNWLFLYLCMTSQISIIYLLYGSLFHMTLEPCISKATLTAVQFLLKDWQFSFNIRYIWIYIGLVFTYCLSILFIVKPKQKTYKIVKIFIILLFVIGAFSRIMGGSGGSIAWQKQSVFGKLGQLLGLIIGVACLLIDMVFACWIQNQKLANKGKVNRVIDDSNMEINFTESDLLPD